MEQNNNTQIEQNMDNQIPELPFRQQVKPNPKSIPLAGFLSMMPGLGQVYVGYYKQGFINILVFAGCITLIAQEETEMFLPLIPIFIFFFWAYNIIDAVRKASFYNRTLAGGTVDILPEDQSIPGLSGSIPGGIIVILISLVVLSYTAFDVPMDWLEKWWPLFPVGFGAYLIFLDFVGKNK